MPIAFTLKVFLFGEKDAVLNKYMFIDDQSELAYPLHKIIKDEVNEVRLIEEHDKFDGKIKSIIGRGGVDLSRMLDKPVYLFPKQFSEINVTIYSSVAESLDKKKEKLVNLVEENKRVMTLLTSKFTLEEVHEFQRHFRN